jgi:hypothetical protein
MRKSLSSFSLISISARRSRGLDFQTAAFWSIGSLRGLDRIFGLVAWLKPCPFKNLSRIGFVREAERLPRASKRPRSFAPHGPFGFARAGSRGARPYVSLGEH